MSVKPLNPKAMKLNKLANLIRIRIWHYLLAYCFILRADQGLQVAYPSFRP
jgi:hypothetical protein